MEFNNIFIGMVISFLLLERFFPRDRHHILSRHYGENIFYWIINEKIIFSILEMLKNFIIITISAHLITPLNTSFILNSFFLSEFILGFLLMDFLQYFNHRLFHSLPWLWKFHALHHSAEKLNFTVDWRNAWMESFIPIFTIDLPILFLGFSAETVITLRLFFMCLSMLQHSNINLPSSRFDKLLLTPHLHLWHHNYINLIPKGQNFGVFLTLWDKVFGTYYWSPEKPQRLGFQGIENYTKQPFLRYFYPFTSRD